MLSIVALVSETQKPTITAGAIIRDEAKITGITPALLILIGKNEVLLTLAFNAPPLFEC